MLLGVLRRDAFSFRDERLDGWENNATQEEGDRYMKYINVIRKT